MGTHSPLTLDTPSHRTNRPWTEVVKGVAAKEHTPDRSFESANLFSRLHSDADDESNDSSRSRVLLTPGANDTIEGALTDTMGADTFDGALPNTIGTVPIGRGLSDGLSGGLMAATGAAFVAYDKTIEGIHTSDPAAGGSTAVTGLATVSRTANESPTLSFSTTGNSPHTPSFAELSAIVLENAKGINALKTHLTTLTSNVSTMSSTIEKQHSQIAYLSTALADTKDTAARAFNQALAANVTLTGQAHRLNALSTAVENLPTLENLPTFIQSALDPLETSLSTKVTEKVTETMNLATATAETTIRTSFDLSATELTNRVNTSLATFEKRIDALHGSTYGHLTKTTLPALSRQLDALEAHATPAPPPPTTPPTTSKPDPVGDDTIRTVNKDSRALT